MYSDIFKRASKIGNTILSIFLISCIALALYARVESGKTGGIPNIFGYTPTIVVSGSMLPTIQVDSLNIIHNTPYDDIEVGDIIVYRNNSMNILHRVIEITTDNYGNKAFITKGDANNTDDGIYVTEDLYRGKIVYTMNWTVPFLREVVQRGSISYLVLLQISLVISLIIWLVSVLISLILGILIHLIIKPKNGGHENVIQCKE